MNLLSRVALACALALPLAACGSLAAFDLGVGAGIDVVCKNEPRARLIYTAGVVSGAVKPSKKLSDAFAVVGSGCAARAAGADVTGVAVNMLVAYQTIKRDIPAVEPLPVSLRRAVERGV